MSDLIERQAAIDAVRYDFFTAYTADEREAEIRMLPSAESENRNCESCRYNELEWHEEPCDSCTMGGEDNHWKPFAESVPESEQNVPKGDLISRKAVIERIKKANGQGSCSGYLG